MLDKGLIDADAIELLEPFNEMTSKEDNEFTEEDIKAAAKFYDTKFAKMSRKEISRRTGITIEPSRRNGRKQDEHLKRARLIRTIASYEEVGRPDKQAQVEEWQKSHPDGKKIDCHRETGLSRDTIRKWWNTDK
jgi:response regulator of citrate/malate metabolism